MRLRHRVFRSLGAWWFALHLMRTSPLRTWTHVIACSWGVIFLVFFDTFLYELRAMNVQLLTKAGIHERVLDFPLRLDFPLARHLDNLQGKGISFVPWISLTVPGFPEPLMGVTRSFFDQEGFRLTQGRRMEVRDCLAGSPCCWVGARRDHVWTRPGDDPRDRVIDGKILRVAGAYQLVERKHPLIGYDWAGLRPWDENALLIPLSTAIRLFPDCHHRFSLLVRVDDPSALLQSWNEISLILEDLGLTLEETTSRETSFLSEALEQLFRESRRIIVVTQGLIFFFAWANAMNLMVRQTRQRKREIGIMMALGAGHRWIFIHMLREALLIGILSGFLGVIVGVGASFLVGWLIHWEVSIHPNALKLGLASGLVASFAISLFPAWLASRMLPVEALKE